MFYIKCSEWQYANVVKPVFKSPVIDDEIKTDKSEITLEYSIVEIHDDVPIFCLQFLQEALGREFEKLGCEEYVIDLCPEFKGINQD